MSEHQLSEYLAAYSEALDRNLVLLSDPDMEFLASIAGDHILVSGTGKTTPQEIRKKYAGRGF